MRFKYLESVGTSGIELVRVGMLSIMWLFIRYRFSKGCIIARAWFNFAQRSHIGSSARSAKQISSFKSINVRICSESLLHSDHCKSSAWPSAHFFHFILTMIRLCITWRTFLVTRGKDTWEVFTGFRGANSSNSCRTRLKSWVSLSSNSWMKKMKTHERHIELDDNQVVIVEGRQRRISKHLAK